MSVNNFDIAVAVSGGLDSLMALCLLQDAGHRPLAVHGRFIPGKEERLDGLRRTCSRLGVPLEIVDLQTDFKCLVIDAFTRAYTAGQTPNPCVTCNREIKFGLLMSAAVKLGAERLATGHYARLANFSAGGNDYLTFAPAADTSKDQAYFLGLLPPETLHRVCFPLADQAKADLRREVAKRGLVVPEPGESREICFIPDDDYRAFLREQGQGADTPGPMLLPDGREVGRHAGLWQYTEGQRRGLGVAHSAPLYVIGKDQARNALLLGEKQDTFVRCWRAEQLNFFVPPAVWPAEVLVRTRYRQSMQPGKVQFRAQTAEISFSSEHERPAPGQLVAFYTDKGLLLGAGIGVKPEDVF